MTNTNPVEIILKIVSFLDLVDVVRLRSVSKQFRDITYDPSVWRHLYVASPLPRPPGPFFSHSTRLLEDILVQSAQSAKSWTTRTISDVSRTEVSVESSLVKSIISTDRRWYLVIEDSSQIVLRNLDSESFRQVVWKDGENSNILIWTLCSTLSPEGHRVYIILSDDHHYSAGKLLEFRLDVDSGRMDHRGSFDIPVPSVWPSPRLVAGRSPFVYLHSHRLIFDTRTRAFYRFPEKGIKPDETLVLLTATHIIAVYYLRRTWADEASLTIQAFKVPNDPSPNDGPLRVLRLTHEGTLPEVLTLNSLIRNSSTGPISGSTNMRFLGQRRDRETLSTDFVCVDLTLPEPSPDMILPIFHEIQTIFKVKVRPMQGWDGNIFVEASDDGHARGFFANPVRCESYSKISIFKFTIDASGDRCVGVVGKPLPLGWTHLFGVYLHRLDGTNAVFDGVSGRLYSVPPASEGRFVVWSSAL